MKKDKKISMRVNEEVKKNMIEVANYYHLTLSDYLTLLHITTQKIDSISSINNFNNNNKGE